MGVVYEARDPALDRTVALKVIQPSAEGEAARVFEERFLAEARIAAALHHPGIVVVHDVGRDPATGALFIALELLRGETLADLGRAAPSTGPPCCRSSRRWPAPSTTRTSTASSTATSSRPTSSCCPPARPRSWTSASRGWRARAQRLTTTGEFIGTPLYTAPEQAKTEDVDGRADVFSLASVAYTLLTGRAAFLAPTIPGIVHRVVYEEPDPPSRFVPGLPADVERVLARALAKDPARRYPTAEAFAEDVEDVLAGQPPRHAAGDDLVVVEEPESPLAVLLADVPGAAPAARRHPRASPSLPARARPAPPCRPPAGGGAAGPALAAVARACLLALFLWVPGGPRPSALPTRAAGAPSAAPSRRPAGRPPRPAVALLPQRRAACASTSTTPCAAARCASSWTTSWPSSRA